MTNNELSRKVLEILDDKSGSVRFKDLVGIVSLDARTVFKNLFFLEEKGYVTLATSTPTDAVYPQIHLVRVRDKGRDLAKNKSLLDEAFPLSDTTTDLKPHIPPEVNQAGSLTFSKVLELLAVKVRHGTDGDQRDSALEKIESLLSLPFINSVVYGTGKDEKKA